MQLALKIHFLSVCIPGLLSVAHLWTDIKPDSNVKGNKKKKAKGKDKNKAGPGEGLPEKKRPKIEELKVNAVISFSFLFFSLDKKWTTERLFCDSDE